MSLRRTWAMARKEYLHIIRDPRSLALALAIPISMIVLFGYALSLDVDRIPAVVHDSDDSPESRELLSRLEGSRYFRIVGRSAGTAEIQRMLDGSEALLGAVIPRDYSRELLSGRLPELQLLLDGSDSNTASIALGYLDAVVQSHAAELRSRAQNRLGGAPPPPPLEARIRIWYNSELKSRNYIVPGLIAVILTIIGALLTSLTIAREWETGTMEQLLSTPVRPREVVLGKMMAFFLLGLADTLLSLAVALLIFRVPLRGDLVFLATACCVFIMGSLGWGIFVSAVARTQLLAYQMGLLSSFLPAFLLSGFIFPTESMPAVIQAVSYITPARYFITILKGVFLKGGGAALLWREAAFLVAYALLVFHLATRKVGRKLA